jgi:hypothetical protein
MQTGQLNHTNIVMIYATRQQELISNQAIATSLRLYHHQAQKFIEESASPFTFPQLKYLIFAKL